MCGRYSVAKDFTKQIKLVGVVLVHLPFFRPRDKIASATGASDLSAEQKAMRVDLNTFEWKWLGDLQVP